MERDTVIRTIGRLWYLAVALATLGLIALSAPYALSAHYLERTGGGPATATDLEQAIAWDARNVQARRTLAQVYLDQGRPEAALEALRPALGVTPPNPLAPIGSVALYVALGRPDAAIRAYEEAGLGMPSAPAAAAYLEQAETSEPQAAADPGNLYALSRLWQAARAGGDDAAAAGYEDNLRYFDLRAVAIPSDARLADYQARAMAELAEADVWTRETLLNVVSYQVWQFAGGEAGRRAEQVLNGLLARWPDDADLRFFKAELYHRRGDLKPAEAAYQAVLEADVAYTPAYLRLADMYEAVEVATDAEEIWARSADLWAEYRVAQPGDPLPLGRLSRLCARIGCAEDRWAEELNSYLQRCEPEYIASATIGEWTLMGYDVDEARLVRGEPVQLWLFWQPPAECTRAASIPPNVYQVAGRWVEVVDDAVNRVLNGGFELGVAYTSPTGFPDDLYHADPSTRRLVRERRLTDETTVAMLSNPEGVTHSSFMTKWMPVVEDRVYLLGAWVRSVEGKAAVNLQWHVPTEAPPFRDAYVGVAVEQTDWVHYVGVVDMPPGATAARVRLFNWGENARASFDNVVLVEMERPNRVSCGPKD